VNIVAVMAPERTSFLPDVRTISEQGLSRIDVRGWWGIFGPANMPGALVEQLNDAIRTVLKTPSVRQKIENFSAEVWLGSPQELDTFIRSEVPAIQALAKKAGIEPE